MTLAASRSGTTKVVERRRRLFALAALVIVPSLVRLWLIRNFPEPDSDAAGHLGMAHAVLTDPTNVAVHWVYLPAYHFVLAALLFVGLTANAIRVLNCALATLVPVFLLKVAETHPDPTDRQRARLVPWLAALFCALSPLINLLGTSAQQETFFTILVLGATWSIDRERYVLAGLALAVASLVRYEAWGAISLLLALRGLVAVRAIRVRLPGSLARAGRLPMVVTLPSVLAVAAWLGAHKRREGQWFGVLRELYRYTHLQSDGLHRGLLWFPVQQPMFVFGSAVLVLFCIGLRRGWRTSHVVPLGIYGFLVVAYLCKGALGSARYYESLTPFVALYAAHGTISMRPRWRALGIVAASWQLVTLSAQLFRWTWPSFGITVARVATLQDTPGACGSEPCRTAPGSARDVAAAARPARVR